MRARGCLRAARPARRDRIAVGRSTVGRDAWAELCPIVIYVHFGNWATGKLNFEPFEKLGKWQLLAFSVFSVGQTEFCILLVLYNRLGNWANL
jgi:hypothetical protein